MGKDKRTTIEYRRKRTNYTDYRKRLSLLKSGKHRLVVRRSMRYLMVQLVDYSAKGDKVLLTVSSRELSKLGWKHSCKNIPAAYLTGQLFARRAKKAGFTDEAVVDIGGFVSKKESRLYAVVKGAIDNGMNIPISDDVLPSEDRINGAHVAHIAENVPKDDTMQFSASKKSGSDPGALKDDLGKMISKING
ncbi:MAG: 50S ribosomal protein L18 [Candidatus Woesearchaeota archaeon]